MTPDRTDQTTPDDPENVDLGVLSDSGSLDTSGIGILGGQTEQVSVSLPGGNDEDFDDDDVIGDEVAFEAVEIEAVAGSVDDGADVAVLEEWNVEDEPLDATTADDADARSLDVEPITADILIEADAAIDDAARAEASVVDALPVEPIAAEAPLPDASVPATAAVATAAAVPITGSTPTTRRAAQHAEGADRPDRARAVERVVPRSDVTMTSKRLGEFEGGRETADLLTADRLLDPHQIVRPEPEERGSTSSTRSPGDGSTSATANAPRHAKNSTAGSRHR